MAVKPNADKAEAVKSFNDTQELLSHMQREMKVPKSRYNKFGEYYYRNADDIMEKAKTFLPEGATLICSDKMLFVGDRYYVEATAELAYKNLVIRSSALAREDKERKKMNPEQLTGSASSFARKYALNGLFCLDDTQDADATNDHGKASSGDLKPYDKTGNKQIDSEWKTSINLIADTEDADSALKVGRHQWKRMKDLGATEEQLELIQQQAQNRATFLNNKEFEGRMAAE